MTLWNRLRNARFWPMLWKEFIQMRRDRITLGMILGLPAAQLLLFGYAIQTDVRHLKTLVLDESRTMESRALVTTLANTGNFDIIGQVATRAAMKAAIDAGQANAGLVIPPDYERDIKHGRTATAQMLVDAADPQSSAAAISGAQLAAQAMQLSFFFMLPNILLSGYIFPRMAMPLPAQWIGLLLPLTYYLNVLRGILLKGVGIAELWRPTLALIGFATVLFAVSVRRFSKTVD